MARTGRRWIRRVLIVALGALVVLTGSVAAALLILDDDDYSRLSVHLAERLTGRTVAIDGPFKLALSMQPSLEVSGVRVGNPSWAAEPYFAQIGHLELQVALWPLLSGTLSVPRLALSDARIDLERGASGERNWTGETRSARGRGHGIPMPVFGDVKVKNVTGRYRDAGAGRDTTVVLATLSVDDTGGLNQMKGEGTWDGRKIAAVGHFGTLADALAATRPFPLDLTVSLPDLTLALKGTIDDASKGRGLDLGLTAQSDDVSALQTVLGPSLALSGQFDGRVSIKGDTAAPELDRIALTLEGTDRQSATPFSIGVTGRVQSIRPGSDAIAQGVALNVDVTGASAALAGMVKAQLPDLGPVAGRFSLNGSSPALKVSDAKLQIGDAKDLAITASGGIAEVRFAPKTTMTGVDVQVQAKAPTTAAAGRPLGLALPELGPVSVSAQLSGDPSGLDLSQIDLRVGSGDRLMQLDGDIDNLTMAGGNAASATVSGAMTPWLEGLLGRKLPDLGKIQASGQLAGSAGNLKVSKIDIVAGDSKALTIKATSAATTAKGWGAVDIDIAAKDLTVLGALLDLRIPALGPFSYTGRLSGTPEATQLAGAMHLGQTAVTQALTATFPDGRPSIAGKLSTPVLYLSDLGIRPDGPWQRGGSEVSGDGPGTLPFAALQKLDLSVALEIDQIEGADVSIDRGRIDVALKDGHLQVNPLRFESVGGSFEITAEVDSVSTPPEVALDVVADNVALDDVFSQLHKTVPLDGDLDMQVKVTGRGTTLPELVAGLDGSADIAISRGHIYNRYFDLLGTDLIQWLMVGRKARDSTDIRCFVSQFDVEAGDARIRALMLETSATVSNASGEINLANQTLDILVRPHSLTTHLMIATPYRVKGPWRSPHIDYSKLHAAARAVGELALAPIHTLDVMVPILGDHGRDRDHPCLDWAPTPPEVAARSGSRFDPAAAGLTIAPMAATPYVTLTETHLRRGPGTDFALAETIPATRVLSVTGKVEGLGWYRVAMDRDGPGYVWGKLIRPRD